MPFRTIRTSDHRFSMSGLRFSVVKSEALGRRVDSTIFVPKQCKDLSSVPVIVLLHGVYGSHWSWALNAGAHVTLQKMIDEAVIAPFVLVMPSDGLWGDGSAYVKQEELDYEKWIARELPELVRSEEACVDEQSKFFVSGLSMGGWGSLWLGIRNPDVFSGISAHSAITSLQEMKQFVEEDWSAWIANNPIHSIIELVKASTGVLPPLRFDCGTSDPLLDGNRQLSSFLKSSNSDFVYEEFAGGHEWPYWETHVRQTYQFFNQLVE